MRILEFSKIEKHTSTYREYITARYEIQIIKFPSSCEQGKPCYVQKKTTIGSLSYTICVKGFLDGLRRLQLITT